MLRIISIPFVSALDFTWSTEVPTQKEFRDENLQKLVRAAELTLNDFPACLDADDGKVGWFISFYGKWCQHSQALSFIWNDFNTLYGDRVNVAKFDCDAEGHWPICDSFDVEALPTMIWFPREARNEDRTWWQYKGDRNVQEFYRYTLAQDFRRYPYGRTYIEDL